MTHRVLAANLILCGLVFVNIAAADETQAEGQKKDSKKAKQAQLIFDKIKSLSGDWISTSGEHKGKVTFSISVIAGGSAVVEREFPGMPHEMITVYHLDGDNVMLNHYCMLGNQPRMKAKLGGNENTILFNFAGITNLASKDDAHMHEGKMIFVDKDTIKSTWVLFKDGKAAEEHTFELARKK